MALDIALRDNGTPGFDISLVAGAGEITGTLNVTLDAATLTSSGTVDVVGSLSITLGDATLSAAGAVDVQ